MCGSLFANSFPISCIFFYRLCFIVLLKDLWAIHCRHSPRILKTDKNREVSLCILSVSLMFIGFSVYKNDFDDELIHHTTLQQSTDVLMQT